MFYKLKVEKIDLEKSGTTLTLGERVLPQAVS